MDNNYVSLYRFGGYILTGGKLDNGKKWEGIRVLLAKVKDPETPPVTASSVKAAKNMQSLFEQMAIGQLCDVFFDENGKAIMIDCSAYVDSN